MKAPRQYSDVLQLTRQHLEQIRRLIVSHSNQEICGLLAGVGGRVIVVYPVANVAYYPESSYYMEPLEQLAALKDIDQQGLNLLAAYHSHPESGPFVPSPTDIALSTDPTLLHLIIVAGTDGRLTSCKGFRIEGNRAFEIDLEIVDSANPVT